MMAAGRNKAHALSLLMAAGCDVHAIDGQRCTALHHAALHDFSLISFLVANRNTRPIDYLTDIASYFRFAKLRSAVYLEGDTSVIVSD